MLTRVATPNCDEELDSHQYVSGNWKVTHHLCSVYFAKSSVVVDKDDFSAASLGLCLGLGVAFFARFPNPNTWVPTRRPLGSTLLVNLIGLHHLSSAFSTLLGLLKHFAMLSRS